MSTLTQHCRGCKYYGNTTDSCDYFLLTGLRREDPPGKDCSHHKRRTRLNASAIREQAAKGRSACQIAKALGLNYRSVYQFMRYHGITPTRETPALPVSR